MGGSPLRRILFVLCLLIGSYFAHNALDHEINNIEQKHPELFADEIKPYKVIEDYNFVPNGRSGELDDNSKVYYTKTDQQVLDERKRVLGPIPFLSGFCGFLAISSAVVFIFLLYMKISDGLEIMQLSTNKKKQEAYQKVHEENIRQINQNFIEKVENIIKSHESSGTFMTNQEVNALRTELNNIKNFNTRIKAEYMIKQHMKIHNLE